MFLNIAFVHWLVILSLCISIIGSAKYIYETLRGRTKPNRISWGIWAFAPLISVGAALSAGADMWATSRIFLAGFIPLLVFLASFANRQSYWKLTKFDFICGALSILAIIAWLAVDMPVLAVLLAAIGDGFAALPTIRKAWLYPETESGLVFFASLIATLLVLPSITEWNIVNSAFQVYLLVVNTMLVFAIYRKRLFY